MKKFVHLHVHTEYSLLDGATKIKDLVAEVAKRGDGAVAITDHGNMYGVLNFYGECLKHKIKPIIGCEFYICHDLTRRDNKSDQAPAETRAYSLIKYVFGTGVIDTTKVYKGESLTLPTLKSLGIELPRNM
ncbi:MAG: PHP domain-containing protein, partial [Clostridia bacterium]|nr:PHP domain-containing protein [Clostridia bacterium]